MSRPFDRNLNLEAFQLLEQTAFFDIEQSHWQALKRPINFLLADVASASFTFGERGGDGERTI